MKTVITKDTNRDITEIVRVAAQNHGFDPIGFIGGAIAESNLHEHAAREQPWPDVSYGLWQPAVAFLGPELPGLTRNANGTVQDTAANRERARKWCNDAANLTPYVAKRYAALLQQFGSPLEAWCRWNAPAIPGPQNPHRQAYEKALAKAQEFRDDVDGGAAAAVPEPNFVWIGAHPTNFGVGRGGIKPEAIVLHIADGPMTAVDSWFNQIHPPEIGPTSAHFCVGQDGAVHQYVSTSNRAFANGVVEVGYTAKLIDENAGINPNRWTISIEHEGKSGDEVSDAQWEASVQLGAWLFQNRLLNSGATGVAVDRHHVLRHADISPKHRGKCPGWNEIVIADYIARVRGLLGLP